MLFGGTVAGESFDQQFEVGYFVYIEHAPVRETSGTALTSDLIGQEAGLSVLHSVVVRLGDSWFALIGEADLVAGVDSLPELVMDLRTWVADY
jgi:hypothetical protein